MTIGVGIFFPLMLFALARMAFVAVHLAEAPPAPNPGGTAALLPPRENQPRVLWVIFDETDQRLAFEERPVGVDLPQFDRLRSESLYATNAVPPGPSTFFSMPSLIAGRRFSDVEVESRSELKVTDAETGVSKEWSELPNLFSSARELGFNGAVVGWYHPYDRLLGRNLAFCRWFASPTERKRSQHVDALMERQLLRCCAEMFYGRKLFAELCQESLHESLSVVTNAKYGVTLLHLPPPHRPGVYEPKTGAFTIWGMPKKNAYFNNLALADQYLGELRAAMERANLWVKSWVIMSADHSWRESGLYDGRRDLRVPFLVKAAGKSEHMTCAQRLNTVLTHDLILAILSGKVTSQQEAVSWLAEHGSAEPPVDGGHLD
jgi:hypothetical protein